LVISIKYLKIQSQRAQNQWKMLMDIPDQRNTYNSEKSSDDQTISCKTNFWKASDKPGQKIARVLKRLWKRFLVQSILVKWITLILIVLTCAVGILFFSTFLLWKLFSFVIFQIIINGLDWYLEATDNKVAMPENKN